MVGQGNGLNRSRSRGVFLSEPRIAIRTQGGQSQAAVAPAKVVSVAAAVVNPDFVILHQGRGTGINTPKVVVHFRIGTVNKGRARRNAAPLSGIRAPGQLGPHPVSHLVMKGDQPQVHPTMFEHRHGVGLHLPIRALQDHFYRRPVDKVGAFHSGYLSNPAMIGLVLFANDLTVRLAPGPRKGDVSVKLWHPKRVVVGIPGDLACLQPYGLRPVEAVRRKANFDALENGLVAALGVGLVIVPENACAVGASPDQVVGRAAVKLNLPQLGLLPVEAVLGGGVADAHFLILTAFKGGSLAFRHGHALGGIGDDKGAVPALVECLFGVVQDVAIEVVETRLPGVVLYKQRVGRVLLDAAQPQGGIAGALNDTAV